MHISRQISQLLVLDHSSIRHGLELINANRKGMVICVNDQGILQGVLTDGDFRRWAINEPTPDIELPVSSITNRNIVSARLSDSFTRIQSLLNQRVRFLPLVDDLGRLVAVASPRSNQIAISDCMIGVGQPCFVIAEIGNNHNGSTELAIKLVDAAAAAGANCVKFQLRELTALYSSKVQVSKAGEDLGSQYTLDLLSKNQLAPAEMFQVFDYCRKIGIEPLCTPWDQPSIVALERYGIVAYKSASADLTNHDLLNQLAATGKPIICSTGMSTEAEIREAVAVLNAAGAQYCLLHCNSTYPAPYKDINLAYMGVLRNLGDCPVGYSSHDRGPNIALAAVALGANIIEKHITLDQAMEGSDHRVSLLPNEFAAMVAGIRQTEQAMGGLAARRITQGELLNREALGKSLVINTAVEPGEIIRSHMLEVRSPGRGLSPNKKSAVIGLRANRQLQPGDILFESDLGASTTSVKTFSFARPFGIPVRFHDLGRLGTASNFDILEFHLSYGDLREEVSRYFKAPLDMDFVVHAPELFTGDHILDLASMDTSYRDLSITHLRGVVGLTRELRKWFLKSTRPRIVINAGGATLDNLMESSEVAARYALISESLARLDLDESEIVVQTMPPFPWHFGGQRFHNLFVNPNEIAQFCITNGCRICLDTCHAKMACNHHHWSFSDYIATVGPYISHLHIADAAGVDGEGLQVNSGEIDFLALGRQLRIVAPHASFIPEIWQGHKNEGADLWLALERLEAFL